MSNKLQELVFSHKIDPRIKNLPYGTTGYRMNYQFLDGIIVRMSILAKARSIYKGKSIGLMITASHNLECDNGIKVIDPNGEMLTYDWESIAMEFIQWDEESFIPNLHAKCQQLNIDFHNKGHVLIGFDTRPSCPRLVELATAVLKEVSCQYCVFPLVTTPQLHFFVKHHNDKISIKDVRDGNHDSDDIQQETLMNFYFQRLAGGFQRDLSTVTAIGADPNPSGCSTAVLNVDCANGVGAGQLSRLAHLVSDRLILRLHNTGTDNLNQDCGADFVKLKSCTPVIHNGDQTLLRPGQRWCSIDGDADRLVYFYLSDDSNRFHLLDGDKIATLIGEYLKEILHSELNQSNQFSIAIIQTDYANAASTEFIQNQLRFKVECVPTGIKHLHEAAKKYDIGIYFEANGHGTVLFSERLRSHASSSTVPNQKLQQFIDIINEADGDAISDLLITEHILSVRQYDLAQWDSMYTDYPNLQLKVPITEANRILSFDEKGVIKSPLSLQDNINKMVDSQKKNGMSHSRAFVRRSGTENIIRIYVESSTQSGANELAESIKLLIENPSNILS